MKSKKAAGWLLTAVFVVLAALAPARSGGMRVYAADSDFEITDGVLTNYKGSGGAVKIPSGKVTAIDDEAFYNCVGITSLTVPEGVKTVGKKAFYNCSSMTDISLPASVKSIGELSFEGCSKLQNINVAENSGYYASEGGVLLNSEKTQLLRYPQGKTAASYTVPSGVTVIGRNAFAHCLSLVKIMLPTGLKQISDNAFYGDSGIASITIPSAVTSIGSAFLRRECLHGHGNCPYPLRRQHDPVGGPQHERRVRHFGEGVLRHVGLLCGKRCACVLYRFRRKRFGAGLHRQNRRRCVP